MVAVWRYIILHISARGGGQIRFFDYTIFSHTALILWSKMLLRGSSPLYIIRITKTSIGVQWKSARILISFKGWIMGDVLKVRGIHKIFIAVCGSRTTSPHISTGETRVYTQHFDANLMSGKIRV